MNDVFGTPDISFKLEEVGESKFVAGVSAIVRVTLKDGTYHEVYNHTEHHNKFHQLILCSGHWLWNCR
jgi:hypothetical protein